VETIFLRIALDTPLDKLFDYRWQTQTPEELPKVGQLALVPFGRQEIFGLIVEVSDQTDVPLSKLRDAISIRDQVSPLTLEWMQLVRFAADYYHRPLGEVALPALPKNLKALKTIALNKAEKKLSKLMEGSHAKSEAQPVLNQEQQLAVDTITASNGYAPYLLLA